VIESERQETEREQDMGCGSKKVRARMRNSETRGRQECGRQSLKERERDGVYEIKKES